MTTEVLFEGEDFLPRFPRDSSRTRVLGIIKDMVAFSESLVVDSEPAYKKITSLYKQARDWKKVIEAKRKDLGEPYRGYIAKINDQAAELSDPLDTVIEMANAKAQGYQRLLEEQKRLEDQKLRATAAIFDAEDEIYIPPMEKIIRGDGAIAVTKTAKAFKVVDISLVPHKYLMIDEKSVMQDVKLGISEIPGLEIYETTTTNLRVR